MNPINPIDRVHPSRQIADLFAREHPVLWQLAYPRIYQEPSAKCGTYYSPKLPAIDVTGVGIKWNGGFRGENEAYEHLWASRLVECHMPMYWISKEMATAIEHTTPPLELHWHDMELPFEAMIFMLPKGTLVHPTEGDVGYVSYARLRKGVIRQSPLTLLGRRNYGSINGSLEIFVNTVSGSISHWNIPYDVKPVIRLPQLEEYGESLQHVRQQKHAMPSRYDCDMTVEDNQILTQAAHYVFGALLLMLKKPELITHGKLLNRVKRQDKVNEFWSPNILGEKYRIRREEPLGTHASPMVHWVRGHWKEQAHGPKFSLRKDVWIEPHLRGGNVPANRQSASA
jgi:hypothetical protein